MPYLYLCHHSSSFLKQDLQGERARASALASRVSSLEADLAEARKRVQELQEVLDLRAPASDAQRPNDDMMPSSHAEPS